MLIAIKRYGVTCTLNPSALSQIAVEALGRCLKGHCLTVAECRFSLVVVRAYGACRRVSPGLLEEPGLQPQKPDQLKQSVNHLVIADLDVNGLYTCNRKYTALTRANGTPGDGGGSTPCGEVRSCLMTPCVDRKG